MMSDLGQVFTRTYRWCGKIKSVLGHAVKIWNGGTVARIPKLSTRSGEWWVSYNIPFTPREKKLRYQFNKNLSGFHDLSGRCVEENGLFPLPGIEPRFLGRPSPNLVPILRYCRYEHGICNDFVAVMAVLPYCAIWHGINWEWILQIFSARRQQLKSKTSENTEKILTWLPNFPAFFDPRLSKQLSAMTINLADMTGD